VESSDESDESDESYGVSAGAEDFESDESDESDEGSGESDEFYQASGESDEAAESDESDESDGESDEAFDEGVTMSASARLRADQDRNRRSSWARRMAADQRIEAQRAAAAQRSLSNELKAIRPGTVARVQPAAPIRGAFEVTAILPNGRKSRMRIVPQLAAASEVNRLRQTIAINDRRQAAALQSNARAIQRLKAAHLSTVKKISAEFLKSDKDLRQRLLQGDNRLDKRITKELGGGAAGQGRHGKRMMQMLKRQRQRSLLNTVTLALAMPMYAAYGDRQNPLGYNNKVLTASLGGWLLSDELVDMIGSKSSVVKGGANLWSWIAPVGNVATAAFFLKDRQHERFVSGVTTVTGGVARVPLAGVIKKKSIDDLKVGAHSAVATILGAPAAGTNEITVRASVGQDGFLTLTLDADPAVAANASTRVAWIVDTQSSTEVAPVV
jgi:hypothetical protein